MHRAVLAFAILAAFLAQVFVADNHWHWNELGFGVSPEAAQPSAQFPSIHDSATTPRASDVCPICQGLAAAGRVLDVASASFVPPAPTVLSAVALNVQRQIKSPVSHTWRGADRRPLNSTTSLER